MTRGSRCRGLPGSAVQRTVVGVTVGSPGALVGHVRQVGPVLDPEQVTQPEPQIRVGAGVGDQDVRPLAVIEAERDIERVQ